jgi:hypothetical protein
MSGVVPSELLDLRDHESHITIYRLLVSRRQHTCSRDVHNFSGGMK